VSTEITGCCCRCACATFALIYSNWAFRSGFFEPSFVLRLNWRENPSSTNSLSTVSALIGCPISVKAAASLSMLFETQIKGRMGSPSVAGSTRLLGAGIRPRSLSRTARRPPPERRTVPFGCSPASRSSSPRLSRASQSRNPRHCRQAAATRRPRLNCRKQPPSSFVKLRAERFPPLSNSFLVDRSIDLPPFALRRNPQSLSQSAAEPFFAIQLFLEVS
jgi:hypothetical protein